MTSSHSLSEQLKLHINKIQKSYSRVNYYQKHFKIVNYIEMFGIFTVNTILTEMVEDQVKISHSTISKYCRYLVVDNFLSFIAIPTRFKRSAQLYWLNDVSVEEINKMVGYYRKINAQVMGHNNENSSGKGDLYKKTVDKHTVQSIAHRTAREAIEKQAIENVKKYGSTALTLDVLELTEEESEIVSKLPTAGVKYARDELFRIKQLYFRNRYNLSEQESLRIFKEQKEEILQHFPKQKYLKF